MLHKGVIGMSALHYLRTYIAVHDGKVNTDQQQRKTGMLKASMGHSLRKKKYKFTWDEVWSSCKLLDIPVTNS